MLLSLSFVKETLRCRGMGRGGNEELSFEDCVHKGSLNVCAPGFEVFHFNFKKHLLYHVNAWFQGFQFQIFKNT